MDAQRFDNLARSLAGRISRRGALRRAGAAASATLLASAGVRAAPATALAQGQGEPIYTMIRRYSLGGPADAVRQALMQGYVEDACKAPGFVAYFTVEDEDGDFATVAVFASQQDFDNFANAEADWIAQNLGDLLPAPDEAVSGQTFVHVGSRQAFRNTCPGDVEPTAAAPTAAPAAPTPAAPTAAPSPPTPAPAPCTAQGCVCTTGTQSPCDSGLICCPTTDRMGGPGVCQPEAVCYPNQCTSNGDACAATCAWGDACPSCCSNFCNSGGQCDNLPVGCTGAGCGCTTGTQNPCDAGLICCGTTGTPGGPGICTAQTDCGAPCTGANCACAPGDPNFCDQGLTCCAVQSGYICISSAQCPASPCTSDGCQCTGGTDGACDAGLVCCTGGGPGSVGTCLTDAECSAEFSCTGTGCDCTSDGDCDSGLMCCVQGDPGAPGTCQTMEACPGSLCTGEGCDCTAGTDGACADGLVCCSGGGPGAAGTCMTDAACNAPNCDDIGVACDPSCAWGDSCGPCCSGYCNSTGQCDFAPSSCTSEGCDCISGTDGACDDGLVCCAQGDPGAPGTCQTGC